MSQTQEHDKSAQKISPDVSRDLKEEEVRDRLNLIYFIAMALGFGILNTYNFLVSAPDYFEDRYPNYKINFYIVPVYTYTNVAFLILSTFFGEALSMTTRVVCCFLVTGLSLFFPFATHFVFKEEQSGYYFILGVAALTGVTTATLQCTITGFCNYLPVEYIMVSIAGQSIAGIAAGVLRVAVNVLQTQSGMDAEMNGFVYFGIGGLFNIGCGLSFLFAIRSAFVRFHLRDYFWTRKYRGIKGTAAERLRDAVLQRADTQTILKKMVDDALPTPKPSDFAQTPTAAPTAVPDGSLRGQFVFTDTAQTQVISAPKKKRLRDMTPYGAIEVESDSDSSSEEDETAETVEFTYSSTATDAFSVNSTTAKSGNVGAATVLGDDRGRRRASRKKKRRKKKKRNRKKREETKVEEEAEEGEVTMLGVFGKIKALWASLFLIFFVTFLVFPGMLVAVESQNSWIRDSQWISMSVLLVLIYNVTDYVGRQFLAGLTTFSFSKRTLWIGCAWRLLLYPVFVMLYLKKIENDWIAYGATVALGLSNGHFCCLCFVWAPSMVNAKEQPLMGSLMSFGLVLGIVCGSNCTLLLNTLGVM